VNKAKELVKTETTNLNEWLNTKAEANLVEIEKKSLQMKTKWENLMQF
jgi:hypothetical protein